MSWRPFDIKDTWNPAYIENYIRYAEQDIEDIKKFIEKVQAKLELVKSIKWTPVVELNRYNSRSSNRVEYYVTVRYIAEDDPQKSYYPTPSYSKKFVGKERKAAFEYAEKLAQELGAEIERSGFS